MEGPLEPEPSVPEELAVPEELLPAPTGVRAAPEEALALLPVSAERPGWGTVDALATVALFGDLECRHTRRALGTVLRLGTALGQRLRFVYYHAPVGAREPARAAATTLARLTLRYGPDAGYRFLAEAARSTASASPNELERWISAAKLPVSVAELGLESLAGEAVERDEQLAALLHVRSTPTLFVNGLRLEGTPPDDLLERAVLDEFRSVRWLRAQGLSGAQSYVRRVRKNLINLEADAADRHCVPLEGAPLEGPAGALVTIVEFSDFECTHCRALWPRLESVMKRHSGEVRRAWRSFAGAEDPRSRRSALFALAARATSGEPGFWALHDALLSSEGELDDPRLLLLAERLGLDGERLLAATQDPRRLRELDLDQVVAQNLSLAGTPTLFVNGRRLTGAISQSVLAGVVDDELRAARRLTRAGTPPERFQELLCESDVRNR
ncbi:MAG TPA: thioredoxin domain-containing protein [Polyangiaceae bacterium]